MSATEPLTGTRIPTQSDGPLGGLQIANAVNDLADNTIPNFATVSARDAAFAAWVAAGHAMRNGLHCHVTGVGDQVYLSGSWRGMSSGVTAGRVWTFARTTGDATFATGTPVPMFSATISAAPAGDYQITSRLVISSTTAGAGFMRTTAGGVAISPTDPRADTLVANGRHVFIHTGGVTHAGGDLVVVPSYNATSAQGTPTVWGQGTEITVAYLGPR